MKFGKCIFNKKPGGKCNLILGKSYAIFRRGVDENGIRYVEVLNELENLSEYKEERFLMNENIKAGDMVRITKVTDFDVERGLELGMLLVVEDNSTKDLQGLFVQNPFDPRFPGVQTINYMFANQIELAIAKRDEGDFIG